MRIVVLGASGLIGAEVCAHLLACGHQVTGVARHIDRAIRRTPQVRWLKIDLATATAADWASPLTDADAVINCAGALQDGPADSLAGVHLEGLTRLAQACQAAGVRRFIQISAASVETAPGAFSRTKADGDAALAATDLDWVILRPGLVLASAAYGGSALLRALAAFPFVMPAVHAQAVTQVVAASDIGRLAEALLAPDAPRRLVLEVGAPEPTPLAEVLKGLRAWMGLKPAPVLDLPPVLARLTGGVADALAWLGWKSPMRSTTLGQLAHGVRVRPEPLLAEMGLAPRSLADQLAQTPAGVQELWFARTYLLKPLLLGGLSLFWITSGVIGVISQQPAEHLLTSAGFPPALASLAVLGGAAADVLVGGLVAFRRTARLGLLGMIGLTLSYVAGAAIWRPDLWLDPLGPMVKTLPAAILALVALAILEDR